MLHVVALTGHQMAASHIQPLDVRQETAETPLHLGQCPLQIIGGRLTQGMEMQPLDTLRQLISQQVAGHPHPGTRGTRIIQVRLHVRVFRIDPQSTRHPVTIRPHHRIKTMELRERVKRDMTTVSQDQREISLRISRGIGMRRTSHFLEGQLGLKFRTCCRKRNVLTYDRERFP